MSVCEITEANFESEVIKSGQPVLIDFWAPWCGPCKMVGPLIEEIAEEYIDKLKVGKINVDENQQLAAKFQVTAIPTIMIFKDGQVNNQIIGMTSKDAIVEKLGF